MIVALQVPWRAETLDEVTALGLDAIQLRVGPGFPLDACRSDGETFRNEAQRAAADLKTRGLKVVALGYYRNLLEPDPDERRREIQGLRRTMAVAELFDTRIVGVFAGRHPERPIDDNLDDFVQVWRPLADEAEGLGLGLAFENCTMFKGYPVRGINLCHTPHAYRQMFERLPHPALGIELDPSHLHKQRIDSIPFVERFGERILHVHAKDHERSTELEQLYGCFDPRVSRDRLPGRGEIDFTALVAALRRVGYDGPLTLELERHMPDLAKTRRRAELRRTIELLRRLTLRSDGRRESTNARR